MGHLAAAFCSDIDQKYQYNGLFNKKLFKGGTLATTGRITATLIYSHHHMHHKLLANKWRRRNLRGAWKIVRADGAPEA